MNLIGAAEALGVGELDGETEVDGFGVGVGLGECVGVWLAECVGVGDGEAPSATDAVPPSWARQPDTTNRATEVTRIVRLIAMLLR